MKRWIGGTVFSVLTILSIVFGFFSYLLLAFFIAGLYEMIQMYLIKKSTYLFFYGLIYLLGVFAMLGIYYKSPAYMLIFVGGIMLNDSFAYFTGKAIGKTKFSKTSPNKTIEGLVGGIIIATILVCLAIVGLSPTINSIVPGFIKEDINLYVMAPLLMLTFVLAVIGDLAESKLKRITGIKDSGTIIYGHGGILDRIDSWVLAAIPMFIILVLL